MQARDKKKTDETREVENLLRQRFPSVEAYRQNPASIRIRIIDARFAKISRTERDRMVEPVLEQLPVDTQNDIAILLLLSPDKASHSMMNVEFEDPVESML